jgi:hypothetical protein
MRQGWFLLIGNLVQRLLCLTFFGFASILLLPGLGGILARMFVQKAELSAFTNVLTGREPPLFV